MDRRSFIAASAAGLAGAAAATSSAAVRTGARNTPFRMRYAPHFGMFRHHAGDDPIDQLKFAADEGFTAWEDNGMAGRPIEDQERIAREMDRLGMMMGVFVASANWGKRTFVHKDDAIRDQLIGAMKGAVEVANRVNARWCTVLLDSYDPRMDWDYQTANAVDNLKYCAEVCEPHGLVMVLEPLNWLANHPELFLSKIPQAYQICRAVGSPSCKILDDLYHQQVTEGNLIPNIDRAWDEIAYFQLGDNPGRNEPLTGEINFKSIFAHLAGKGYQGVIGMEHGLSGGGKQGERACIEAYRACDIA